LDTPQLNATASVPGTFAYTPASGTLLNAGSNQNLHVAFTPADAADYNGTTRDVSINVLQAITTATISSSLNPSTYGQSITFTASVVSGSGIPTGTVTFYDGAAILGSGLLNGSGKAVFSTVALVAGTHTITAKYGSDGNFASITSGGLSEAVGVAATTTNLTSNSNPSTQGQPVNLVATVTGQYGGSVTGTVTFYDGIKTVLGSASVVNGSALLPLSTLGVGAHTIKATYGGDGNSSGSTSPTITQSVVSKTSTTTFVTSSLNPSYVGQSVTLIASVSPVAATGTVTFNVGKTMLGTATLASGQATLVASSLPAGSLSITAVYGGDTYYLGSSAPTLTQVVNMGTTSTSISSAPNPSNVRGNITFTATVTVTSPNGGVPAGTVSFNVGNTTLGQGVLQGTGTDGTATATFSTSSLSAGKYNVKAVYSGSSAYTGSSSSTVTEVVN
jgi:hypothetical protein